MVMHDLSYGLVLFMCIEGFRLVRVDRHLRVLRFCRSIQIFRKESLLP